MAISRSIRSVKTHLTDSLTKFWSLNARGEGDQVLRNQINSFPLGSSAKNIDKKFSLYHITCNATLAAELDKLNEGF